MITENEPLDLEKWFRVSREMTWPSLPPDAFTGYISDMELIGKECTNAFERWWRAIEADLNAMLDQIAFTWSTYWQDVQPDEYERLAREMARQINRRRPNKKVSWRRLNRPQRYAIWLQYNHSRKGKGHD
jgi:hypothetical protein